MSCIHFIGGEKGGVGKSVLARLLSQYFLDKGLNYAGLDADQSHATLTRFYQEYTRPVNIDKFESIDQIMEMALATEQHVLVDLPAQSQRFLDRWIDDNGVVEMSADMNIALLYWYVVDDGRDSAQLLKNFLDRYQHSLQCITVKNQGRGSDFAELDALPAFSGPAAAGNLTQISLPALHAATLRSADKLDFSFWAAANVKDAGPHLSLMERQRTRVWLKKAYELFDQVLAWAEKP